MGNFYKQDRFGLLMGSQYDRTHTPVFLMKYKNGIRNKKLVYSILYSHKKNFERKRSRNVGVWVLLVNLLLI